MPPQSGAELRFFALTRLGARVLLYGPFNSVLHPEVVQTWLEAILPFEPGNDSERLAWAFCLTQLARRSGQRALDVDDSHRQSVLNVLDSMALPPLEPHGGRGTGAGERRQSQMFGEALPDRLAPGSAIAIKIPGGTGGSPYQQADHLVHEGLVLALKTSASG